MSGTPGHQHEYPTWPERLAARYRAAGYWRDETFCDVLRERAERCGDRTAVVGGATRLTYRELADRADRLAAGMHRMGIRPGDRVVVQLPNVVEFVETCFALFRLGAIAVLALPAHRRTEITQFCALTDAAAYVVPDRYLGFDYRELAAEVVTGFPELRNVVVVGELGDFHGVAGFTPIDDVYADTAELSGVPLPRPSSVALLQLSGGSTGVPKLIPRRHEDYLCAVRASLDACPLDSASVYLGALPVAHNFPLVSPGVFGALYVGAAVVLAAAPSPDVVFPLIESERVTITAAVPPLALSWLSAVAHTPCDLSSLAVLQVGGAACGPELARRVGPELGATLQQVFGMAEGLINYTRLDDPEDVIVHTQGRPCCEADEVRVVDDADRDVPAGQQGHLLTRGPYTIRGYFDAEDHNASAFTTDGFYRTGDLVRIRQDGNLVVVGRAKEQINRGGEKLAPEEVENRLLAHPGVHDAAVVAIVDDYLGERTCAFVIPGEGGLEPRQLTSFLRTEGLAAYKIPDLVEIVEEFPVIGVGKIGKAELRRALGNGNGGHGKEGDGES